MRRNNKGKHILSKKKNKKGEAEITQMLNDTKYTEWLLRLYGFSQVPQNKQTTSKHRKTVMQSKAEEEEELPWVICDYSKILWV